MQDRGPAYPDISLCHSIAIPWSIPVQLVPHPLAFRLLTSSPPPKTHQPNVLSRGNGTCLFIYRRLQWIITTFTTVVLHGNLHDNGPRRRWGVWPDKWTRTRRRRREVKTRGGGSAKKKCTDLKTRHTVRALFPEICVGPVKTLELLRISCKITRYCIVQSLVHDLILL